MSEPLKVFITYSHNRPTTEHRIENAPCCNGERGENKTFGTITRFSQAMNEYKDISTNLAASDILLYLVSATSLASKNCNKELAEGIKREG